jgi:hypothetical protein
MASLRADRRRVERVLDYEIERCADEPWLELELSALKERQALEFAELVLHLRARRKSDSGRLRSAAVPPPAALARRAADRARL